MQQKQKSKDNKITKLLLCVRLGFASMTPLHSPTGGEMLLYDPPSSAGETAQRDGCICLVGVSVLKPGLGRSFLDLIQGAGQLKAASLLLKEHSF